MPTNKGPNLFTYLNAIFNKSKIEYNKKLASAYMLSLWLSHDPYLIEIVNNINHLQFNLDDGIIYKYYFNKVPKKKRFIKWTKKEAADKNRKKQMKEITTKYGISKKEAGFFI